MAERTVYCTNCGSMVKAGTKFCAVCGTAVSPNAPDAMPTRDIPTRAYAPPEARSHGRRGLYALLAGMGVVALLVVVVVAIFAVNLLGGEPESDATPPASLGGGEDAETGDSPDEPEPDTSGTDGSGASEPEDESLGVGDSVEVNGVNVTLNGVRTLPASDFDQPLGGADNSFLAADVTFENTSEEPVAVSSLLEFTLRDEDGYSASQTVHSQQRQLAEGNVAPGQNASGEIVYEVPPDASALQLAYAPFAGLETFVWDIGDPESVSGPAVAADGIEPLSVTASSTSASAPDASGDTISYEPEQAADGVIDTAWNVDGDGVGESITLEYDEPVTVGSIGVVPGYDKVDPSDGTYRFFQLYVIERAEISFSDGSSVEADFERDPEMQYVEFPETETDSITITILDTYPPGPSPYGETYPYDLEKAAISEIEVEGP